MKILFTSTYYNNPAFIALQKKSLELFLVPNHQVDFMVMDDAEPNTPSLIDGGCATEQIKAECEKHSVMYRRVPQHVHKNIKDGGLVPNGAPAGHPTERHRACLHYILQNHETLGWKDYDFVILAESDMLLRKPVDLHAFANMDIIGTGRKNHVVNRNIGDDADWPHEYIGLNQVTIDFFTLYFTIFNMKMVTNLHQFNIGGFGATDTGGLTSLFVKQYPQYNYHFMDISGNKDYQIDFFTFNANGRSFEAEAEFVHYRGGSNWDYQSKEYYWEKFYRMLRTYVPELYDAGTARHSSIELTSRDKEHTFKLGE